MYACIYTVITRGSEPLKRSIIYAGRVTAHWLAYSAVEKRLPRKVNPNERQTSGKIEGRGSPPLNVLVPRAPLDPPFEEALPPIESRRPRGIHASLIRSLQKLPSTIYTSTLRPAVYFDAAKNDGPITRRREPDA